MKIVILDGFTANPGDLVWDRLEVLGELIVYDRTPENLIADRCKDAEIIFTNKTPLTAGTLSSLPSIKYIGVLATGYNVVDVKYCRTQGVTVCNVPSYSTFSVAQNVFAMILEFTNRVSHYDSEVKDGKWSSCNDFCFIDTPLTELAGKQLGIVGLGSIGSRVALIGLAFGMTVAAVTSKSEDSISPIMKLGLKELFSTSDIISLHCPLTEDTFHLVDHSLLSLMKEGSILINTGRGQLIDEAALYDVLVSGKINAGLDVLSQEPPSASNRLIKAPNLIITPHISWATSEARQRLIDISVDNLEAYLAGKPQNIV